MYILVWSSWNNKVTSKDLVNRRKLSRYKPACRCPSLPDPRLLLLESLISNLYLNSESSNVRFNDPQREFPLIIQTTDGLLTQEQVCLFSYCKKCIISTLWLKGQLVIMEWAVWAQEYLSITPFTSVKKKKYLCIWPNSWQLCKSLTFT